METRFYKPGSFNRVILNGPGKLRIVQSGERQLVIRAAAEIIDDVVVSVSEGTLSLGIRNSTVVPMHLWRHQVVFELSTSDLQAITSIGSGSVDAAEVDAGQLALKVTGSGLMDISNLIADTVRIELVGSGEIKLAGDVETQQVLVNGSGRYLADNLMSDFASIRLNGSGSAALHVADHLDVFIGGSGKVSYQGFPDVTKRIFGSGVLNRIRKARRAAVSE